MRISLIIITLLASVMCYAQMTPAKVIPPKVKESIKINTPAQKLWEYLLKFDNIEEFGSELVSKRSGNTHGINAQREIILLDGTVRNEKLAYINEKDMKMSVEVLNPGEEFSRYFYIFKVKRTNDTKCKVDLSAYYELKDQYPKSKFKKQISKEFKILLQGLKQTFEN